MTLTTERAHVESAFSHVEELERIAKTFDPDDDRRGRLFQLARRVLAECTPLRPRIAATLLRLSEPTVRAWARQGILTPVARSPRLLLDPTRVHDVMHLVYELQEAGKTASLVDEVCQRLAERTASAETG